MDVYIIGAGGLGREMWFLSDTVRQHHGRDWHLAGFADADPSRSMLADRFAVVSDDDLLGRQENYAVVLGIGSPATRLAVARRYQESGHAQLPVLVHPSATIEGPVQFGAGVCVAAHCSVTADVALGDFVLLNPNVTVGHDTTLGAGTVVNPGANIAGNVDVGTSVLVGAGATILQGLAIGDAATVGAGAVVTRDVPRGVIVMGVPARAHE